jgi:hypothetical protein
MLMKSIQKKKDGAYSLLYGVNAGVLGIMLCGYIVRKYLELGL